LFSVEWLADFVDLSGYWSGPGSADDRDGLRRLGDALTGIGLAVEGQETYQGAAPAPGVPLLDIDVTTNRTDCMNHFGIARELAVALGRPLRAPRAALRETAEDASALVRVELDDPTGCPRFCGRIVRGVKIGPSPDWLQERLRSIGKRPISNVVDVTNYVMWELGQPLHAYDLAKLAPSGAAGGAVLVRVRRARSGESLRTLDGETRKLSPEVLVIADEARAIGLGGIMGGADTEVTDTTRDVLLEAAHFDRRTVRLGAKQLGMHTDASHRFERGADPEGPAFALRRAAALLAEIAGGAPLAGTIEAVSPEHLPAPAIGLLDGDRMRRFAGAPIPDEAAHGFLRALGFGIELADQKPTVVRCSVPSWRRYDFEPMPRSEWGPAGENVEEQELFEEVIRHYGFDNIAPTLPTLSGKDAGSNPTHALRHRVRDHLRACGLAEVINFAFSSNDGDAKYPALAKSGAPLRLVNPIAETHAILRRSLLPNLVESAEFNWRRGGRAVRLFEAGHVFPGGGPSSGQKPWPARETAEIDAVALVVGGVLGTPWDRQREIDLFDLKGIVESLAADCSVRLEARPARLPGYVQGSAAELVRDGAVVGSFGRLEGGDAPFPLFAAELRLDALRSTAGPVKVEVPSRFPGVAADLTFTHPVGTAWSAIAAAIAERAVPDLRHFGLKDRYQGKGVPDGAVNTTIAFLYVADDRSLTQEEVNSRHLELAAALQERFGWKA
jgi:phenylalanyl-tRNA synthetase beta chain